MKLFFTICLSFDDVLLSLMYGAFDGSDFFTLELVQLDLDGSID